MDFLPADNNDYHINIKIKQTYTTQYIKVAYNHFGERVRNRNK